MNWKFTGDRPVYQQIMENIRGAILKGELPPGARVPSVRDLATQAQVNPNTMQRALAELENDGLAESNRTTGRMVTTDAAIIEVVRSALAQQCIDGFYEGMEQLGYTQEAARQKLEEQSNGK